MRVTSHSPWRRYLPLALSSGSASRSLPGSIEGTFVAQSNDISLNRHHSLFEVGIERSIVDDESSHPESHNLVETMRGIGRPASRAESPLQFKRPASALSTRRGQVAVTPLPTDVHRNLPQSKEWVDYMAASDALGAANFHYSRDEAFNDVALGHRDHLTGAADTLTRFNHRISWLLVLLVLQSLSSFVLKRFELLIIDHPVIILFLTMLVGAGGNAGSQSTVLAVRNIATGSFISASSNVNGAGTSVKRFVAQELWTGVKLACLLSIVAVLRVYLFNSNPWENAAIGLSMFAIVITSVFIGTIMPLLLWFCRCDPAHAGAAIQVTIDILGVTITCLIATTVFSIFMPHSQS